MIIIHIEPPEIDLCDDEKIVAQEQISRRRLTKYFLGTIFLLTVVIISMMTACSRAEIPATYQYQAPAKLDDGWETASLTDAELDSELFAAMTADIQDGGFDNLHSLLIVKDGRLPSLRDTWDALLPGLVLLIDIFGFLIISLS